MRGALAPAGEGVHTQGGAPAWQVQATCLAVYHGEARTHRGPGGALVESGKAALSLARSASPSPSLSSRAEAAVPHMPRHTHTHTHTGAPSSRTGLSRRERARARPHTHTHTHTHTACQGGICLCRGHTRLAVCYVRRTFPPKCFALAAYMAVYMAGSLHGSGSLQTCMAVFTCLHGSDPHGSTRTAGQEN